MSGVIKADDAAQEGLELRVFSLRDIQEEAQKILELSKVEAATILQGARTKVEAASATAGQQARAEGHRQGMAQGLEAGRQAGLEEARQDFAAKQADLTQGLTALLKDVDGKKHRLVAQAHGDLVDLAMAIARRVVKRALDVQPGVAEANVRDAVKLVGAASDVTIVLNPADVEAVSQLAEGLEAEFGRLKHFRMVADASVSPGGCVVRTDLGEIDAQLDTQLARIAKQLLPGREQE